MKRTVYLILIMCLLTVFCGCFFESDIEVTEQTAEETYFTEPVDEPSVYEMLQEKTGYESFFDYINEHNIEYTISYQRELFGKTYLLFERFDIFEANGKIYVQADAWYDAVILIEITEEQCSEILSYDDSANIVFAFRVDDVAPISLAYYPWEDYSYEDVWDDDSGDYLGEFIDEDSIRAYIDMSSHYRLIEGTCVEIYLLEE